MLPIVIAPHPVLSQIAKPVKMFDKNLLDFIEQMKQTLANTRDPEGVGLAAPQVGRSLQIFIAKETPKAPFLIFINPKIQSRSNVFADLKRPKGSKKPKKLEGCLSLPTIWGTVKRHSEITLSYLDGKGHPHTKIFTSFLVTIIQHEIDHLHGILFPKRVLEQQGKLYKSSKDKKGEEVFEEIAI